LLLGEESMRFAICSVKLCTESAAPAAFSRKILPGSRDMPQQASRFERSWDLLDSSLDLLRRTRELIILAVLFGVATLLVLAAVFGASSASEGIEHVGDADPLTMRWQMAVIILGFMIYFGSYFVAIFFNVALASVTLAKLDGRSLTVRSALMLTRNRTPAILGLAVLSALAIGVPQVLTTGLGPAGRAMASAISFAWTVVTFLVVPVMVAERVTVGGAIKRSAALLDTSWAENVIGNLSVAVLLFLTEAAAGLIGLGVGLGALSYGYDLNYLIVPAGVAAAALFAVLGFIGQVLLNIYATLLYRSVISGQIPRGIERDVLDNKGSNASAVGERS
jgi:hypothetical protein